jgi:hypothetical protein
MSAQNRFDNLPALAAPSNSELRDELDRYLSSDPEVVQDVIKWWSKRTDQFPCLSRMARDYLSIPGMCNIVFPFLGSKD